jgi:hypothetical protein
VSIGLHFQAPEYLPVGFAVRGNPGLGFTYCSPEAQEACDKLQAGRDSFIAGELLHYRRFYRFSEAGVFDLDAKSSTPLAGATIHTKKTNDGLTFEAELPVSALPRCTSTPIESIGLVAFADATAKNVDDGEWTWGGVGPAAIEPNSAVRSVAFQVRMPLIQPALSYDPGQPNKIYSVGYGQSVGTSLASEEHVLYRKLATDGDIEIGIVEGAAPMLVSLRGGQVVDTRELRTDHMQAGKKSKGTIVVGAVIDPVDPMMFPRPASHAQFEAIMVARDGTMNEGIEGVGGPAPAWESVTPTISPRLDTLTLVGTAFSVFDPKAPASPLQIVWKYDDKIGMFRPPQTP